MQQLSRLDASSQTLIMIVAEGVVVDAERERISRRLEWCEATLVEPAELDDAELRPLLTDVQATALVLRNRLARLDAVD